MKNSFFDMKTAVIGVGSMGQNHARILKEISNLNYVVDVNEEQGNEIAKRFGVNWVADYKEISNLVDAVCICVPTKFHLEVAQFFAESGVHILVEKPIAASVKEAKSICKSAEKNGVVLSVGHVERHNPVVKTAKKLISDGSWGDLITLSSRRVSNFPDRIHDVGVLFDLLIHDLDISNYLVDSKVNSVYAVGGSKKAKHEDYVNVILSHDSSTVSICEANWLTPMKIRKLGITTLSHYIELDYQEQTIRAFESEYKEFMKGNLYASKFEVIPSQIEVTKQEPLLLELVDFLTSVQENKNPLVTGEEATNVVKISEAALSSLNIKRAIQM